MQQPTLALLSDALNKIFSISTSLRMPVGLALA